MKKFKICKMNLYIYVNMIIATILGTYAYTLCGYMNDKIENISAYCWFVILSLTSILLFLIAHRLIWKYIDIQEKKTIIPYVYLFINLLVGGTVSLRSVVGIIFNGI